jgi:hypothetical protein
MMGTRWEDLRKRLVADFIHDRDNYENMNAHCDAWAAYIDGIEKDRDSWKSDRDMFVNAWCRELGTIINKTHLIDALVLTTREIVEALKFHPRAAKLMKKKKNFLVVAEDEPYFEAVYCVIRSSETLKGTWTEEDERIYKSMMGRLLIRHGQEAMGYREVKP